MPMPSQYLRIGETDAEGNLGDACLTAQEQRRRLFQSAVDEEPVGRQTQLLFEEPPEVRTSDVPLRGRITNLLKILSRITCAGRPQGVGMSRLFSCLERYANVDLSAWGADCTRFCVFAR